MTKVGLVMRKIQFTEAQGPRVFADRLQQISRELGVEIVFISPERHVSGYDWLPGYEHEKGDLVNYDIVLDQIYKENIDHVIYTVSGFTYLKMFLKNSVLFPHSFPDPALTGYEMMKPFYQMVDKAVVQTEFLKRELNRNFGVTDVRVIPIGFNEGLAERHFDPARVVENRVLWIGRDEENRRPDLVLEYARQNPDKEVFMVFGGKRYEESMKKYDIPHNVQLKFALTQDEIFALMNSAKVYWSCSKFDTYGMPLTEALAMGKIVVKPEHPCYDHISSRHSFSGNERNWFELVNMAVASPHRVSAENRDYAFEMFSSHVMKQGYRAFYEDWLR
ncbi:glycosyltransferase [Tumebacillus permanentifrigoris]|uniref:Glycosyltransferase involved in cell wall biosynthesis n=1 Tax=Tumebacillus permanentifrigoris TaxID=378543 RepID=A0A316DGY3_9BACL|nr:glycosyltransferase [Tumebacillus permanentifrigoris]PWK16499.1 glycosyltransferase involved in cell wall biosynthesis [Tumebacillus permanentifrigoris]